MDKHNIAFCRDRAVGIPEGGGAEHRQFSEQISIEFWDDRHSPVIFIVATLIFP